VHHHYLLDTSDGRVDLENLTASSDPMDPLSVFSLPPNQSMLEEIGESFREPLKSNSTSRISVSNDEVSLPGCTS
jgi:hypothetical protein